METEQNSLKWLWVFGGALILVVGGIYGYKNFYATPAPEVPPGPPLVSKIKIPLLTGAEDMRYAGEGKSRGCDLVIMEERDVTPTVDPVSAVYKELFMRKEPWPYGEKLGNFITSQTGLSFDRVSVEGGIAKVYLTGSQTLSGVCDDPRLQIQMEEAALQFTGVQEVEVYLNGVLYLAPSGKG